MTIAQQLTDVNTAKQNIKTAIDAKGVSTSGVDFTDYHTLIGQISTGGGGGSTDLGGVSPYTSSTYVRNPDYLADSGLQPAVGEIRMLALVDDLEYQTVTFKMYTVSNSANTISVDWGDGTTGVYTGGAGYNFEHTYNFSALPAGSTTSTGERQAIITLTESSGDPFILLDFESSPPSWETSTSSGYNNGPIVEFYANSASLREVRFFSGYRGQGMMEYIQLDTHADDYYFREAFKDLWHLRKVRLPGLGITTYTTYLQDAYGTFINCQSLREIDGFNTTGRLEMSNMFNGCRSLQLLSNCTLDFSSVTKSTGYAFNGCNSLRHIPLPAGVTEIDLTNQTSIGAPSSMFATCYSLVELPPIRLSSAVTNLANMFQGCRQLTGGVEITFPNGCSVTNTSYMFSDCGANQIDLDSTFDFSSVTTTDSMFRNSVALSRVTGVMDMPQNEDMDYMFAGCIALVDLPVIRNTTKCYRFTFMFQSCHSLEKCDIDLDMSQSARRAAGNDTNLVQYGIFRDCYALVHAPAFLSNMWRAYRFDYMFYNCRSLRSIPSMDLTSHTTTISTRYFAQGCSSLIDVGTLDFTGVTSSTQANNIFLNNYNLSRMDVSLPAQRSISYLNTARLSTTELDNLYTNLPTTTTAYTLQVSGNPGYVGSNTSIATAKGWVIT